MDINSAQGAGRGSQRSRVGVSAEGNAVVVWGENVGDGRPRVYERRVTGLNPSVAPQELSLNQFAGQIGGRADQVDIDIEDDGSFAWAVFRQDFGGGSRSVARRGWPKCWARTSRSRGRSNRRRSRVSRR